MKRIGFRVWLPLAFATVVAGFVASTAYTQHRASAIDDAAVAIASNTSPSIEHLSTARAELRHLQLLLSELLEAGTRERPVDETAILETRDRVRQEAVAYLALPVPLEERPLWKAVGAGLTELDEATRGILLQSRLGAHEAARSLYEHEFRAAMDHTSAAIAEIIEFNAQHAQDLPIEN